MFHGHFRNSPPKPKTHTSRIEYIMINPNCSDDDDGDNGNDDNDL